MRSKFDGQLARMKHEVIQMGALCEEAISLAAQALAEGDKVLAENQGKIPQARNRLCLSNRRPTLGGAVLPQGQRKADGPKCLRPQ